MSDIRELVQPIIAEHDNEMSFQILLAASIIPYLEKPLHRARFFNYNKKLELYFDSKDLNRFSRLSKLTKEVSKRIKGKKPVGFERILKLFREQDLIHREKEGPSEGMKWKGFGGVHSHYNLTPLGKAVLIFQACARTNADFLKAQFSDDWDSVLLEEILYLTKLVVDKKLSIKYTNECFKVRRPEAAEITQRVFEFLAGQTRKVTQDELRDFIWDKAGEIHIGEIPGALERLKPYLSSSSNEFALNARGLTVSLGLANVIVEAALIFEETELVHYMISSKTLREGARKLFVRYANWY